MTTAFPRTIWRSFGALSTRSRPGARTSSSLEETRLPLTIPEVETTALQPGPMIVGSTTLVRTPDSIARDLDFMLDHDIHPEIATHDLSHLANAERLVIPKIEKPYYFNIVLGLEGSTYATPANLMHIVDRLPEGSVWMLSIGGRSTLGMLTFAILLGGHIRVGLEDMIYLHPRLDELLKSNAKMVEKMVRIATELGRPIATADQSRKMLASKRVRRPDPDKTQRNRERIHRRLTQDYRVQISEREVDHSLRATPGTISPSVPLAAPARQCSVRTSLRLGSGCPWL
jgi:3-keto-5-aminohexanoate cleavage enzyme